MRSAPMQYWKVFAAHDAAVEFAGLRNTSVGYKSRVQAGIVHSAD